MMTKLVDSAVLRLRKFLVATFGTSGESTDDPLTWQYIILIVVAAVVFVPAINVGMDNLKRGGLTLPFDELELTHRYEDQSGIAVSYPQGWEASSPQFGSIQMTNAPNPQVITSAGDASVTISILARSILADELDSEASPQEVLTYALVSAGLEEDAFETADLTVDNLPAATTRIASAGMDVNLVLIDLDNGFLLLVQGLTLEGTWDDFANTFDRILATLDTDLTLSAP